MKRILSTIAALTLLFAHVACTPDDKNGDDGGGNLNNPDELTVTGGASDITDYSATLTGYANLPFELGTAEMGIVYDDNQAFVNGKKIVATELDDNNKFTVAVTGLKPSTTYYYMSYVQNGVITKYGEVLSFTTKVSPCPEGAVDLGIIMTREDGTSYRIYWAQSNLSKDGLCPKPEDFGDYYAWGETETKSSYSQFTYKWSEIVGDVENGHYETFYKKYCPDSLPECWGGEGSPDNKTVLDPEDDVAHVLLGGNWRMPTKEEQDVLWNNCTWKWSTENGVEGATVTGINGNSIFLPGAGEWQFEEVSFTKRCFYLSSTLYSYKNSPAGACTIITDESRFYNDGRKRRTSDHFRFYGYSIRPVTE